MPLSVERTCVPFPTGSNGCPFSPSIFTGSVIVCKVTFIYCNVCGENSVCTYIRTFYFPIRIICIYICREPIQLTSICNLIHAVDLFRFLIVSRGVFTETIFVPVMIGSYNARYIVAAQHRTITVCVCIYHLVGAVQNRKVVLAKGLVKCNLRLVAVQQIADFAALELISGFAFDRFVFDSFAVFIVISFSGENIAVIIAVVNCPKITPNDTASICSTVLCNDLADAVAI